MDECTLYLCACVGTFENDCLDAGTPVRSALRAWSGLRLTSKTPSFRCKQNPNDFTKLHLRRKNLWHIDSFQVEALLWLELNWCDDEKPMCIPALQVQNCHHPHKQTLSYLSTSTILCRCTWWRWRSSWSRWRSATRSPSVADPHMIHQQYPHATEQHTKQKYKMISNESPTKLNILQTFLLLKPESEKQMTLFCIYRVPPRELRHG